MLEIIENLEMTEKRDMPEILEDLETIFMKMMEKLEMIDKLLMKERPGYDG